MLNIARNVTLFSLMFAVGAAFATIITHLFVIVFFMPSLATKKPRRT